MYLHRTLLWICCFLEIALLTFGRKALGVYGSPVALFSLSVLLGVYPLWIIQKFQLSLHKISLPEIVWSKFGLQFSLLVGGLIALGFWVHSSQIPVFEKFPIARRFSDIIPQIQVLVDRWLAGEFPYKPIQWDYRLYCPYMPLHWMPFALPTIWDIDRRWITLIAFGVAYLIFIGWVSIRRGNTLKTLFVGLFPGLFLLAILLYYPSVSARSAELLLVGYYLVVGLCIISPSPYLRGLGLVLGLMSRYTLVFWVPLYLLMLFLYEDRRKALITAGIGILGVLLIYVIPFLMKDWTIFQQGLDYHASVLEGMWKPAKWQKDYRPYIMIQGMGFAAFFYELPFDLKTKLKIMQLSQVAFSIITVIGWGFLYRKFKEKIPLTIYLLLGLKVYFAVLYSLMVNPYGYYFLLPCSISLVILAWIWQAEPSRV